MKLFEVGYTVSNPMDDPCEESVQIAAEEWPTTVDALDVIRVIHPRLVSENMITVDYMHQVSPVMMGTSKDGKRHLWKLVYEGLVGG
jgi:hypothetical protein